MVSHSGAHTAHDRLIYLLSRLRKKDTKFLESVSSLEKTHKKASDRLKSCQKRLTVGRNEYLLATSTTNAHLRRYIDKDLPQLMQVRRREELVEGGMFSVAFCKNPGDETTCRSSLLHYLYTYKHSLMTAYMVLI